MLRIFIRLSTALLVACATFCLVSCNGEKKDVKNVEQSEDVVSEAVGEEFTEDVTGESDNNVLYYKDGKFVVYNVSDGTTKEYNFENGEILNYALKPQSTLLYYYICDNGNAVLKSVDLAETKPEPIIVVDFGLKCEDCHDNIWGAGYSTLFVKDDASAIGIMHEPNWECFGFCKCKVYYPETGKMNEVDEPYSIFSENPNFNRENFVTETEGMPKFYYVGNDAKICISDKIDMSFAEGDEDYLEFSACSLSPDGKKVLYSAGLSLGDAVSGPYCVASLNGKYQMALENADILECKAIEWLSDGSLVYTTIEQRPETDPEYSEDNTTRPCIRILRPESNESQVLVNDVNYFCTIK